MLDPDDFSLPLDIKLILPSIPFVIGLIDFIYIAVALKSWISKKQQNIYLRYFGNYKNKNKVKEKIVNSNLINCLHF